MSPHTGGNRNILMGNLGHQAFPTKQDIETLIQRVEEAHRRDIQEVRTEIRSLTDRVDTGETSISSLENRLGTLEQSHVAQAEATVALQLHMEDLEDRSRRNNLRL